MGKTTKPVIQDSQKLDRYQPSAFLQSHRYVTILCRSVWVQVLARLSNTTELRTRDMLAVVGVAVLINGITMGREIKTIKLYC